MFNFKSIRLPALAGLLLAVFSVQAVATTGNEISLDGTWEIVFDHENIGREAEWQDGTNFSDLEQKREVTVPSAWELIEKDYEGVAFYRREFDAPTEWKDKVVQLQFGAVNYIAEVWVNDEVVGYHEGGFTPFELRVDRMLKPGKTNVVTLRVQGPIIRSDKEVDGIGPLETPQWRGGISGGIWQSVKLEATDEVYLKDVVLRPEWSNGKILVNLELDNTAVSGSDTEVLVEIFDGSGNATVVKSLRDNLNLRPGAQNHEWLLSLDEYKSWSPDDPYLYTAKVSVLVDGEVSDVWEHRFGFREFTIKDKDFYLNGKRLYLKATFFEGLYPNGIAHPDSEAMVRDEIRLAKEAGFNMIRPWRRPPAPMWLDIADEMGVLVVGSPALECMRLPLSEIREMVLRDRSRTCVVQWELFNELHRPVLMQMMRPMAMLTRDLDPTRMILDESGGWAAGANMYLPGEYEPTKFNDIHNYPGPFINEQLYRGFLTIGMTEEEKRAFKYWGPTPGRNVVPGLMSFVSELGYGSLPNLPLANRMFEEEGNPLTPAYRYHNLLQEGQIKALNESGFDTMYRDLEQFCNEQQSIHGSANKRMIEAVRSNPDVDGYCIHALAAGDWIIGAGLIDLWRNPKGDAYALTKMANQPRIVSIRTTSRNVYAQRETILTITGINDLDALDVVMDVDLVSENGSTVKSWQYKGQLKSGVSQLLKEKINTRDLQGTYTVSVTMVDTLRNAITRNDYQIEVFSQKQLQVPDTRIAVLDIKKLLTAFLEKKGIEFIRFSKTIPITVPVFVTSLRANNALQESQFAELKAFIKKGGTVVYLEGTGQRFDRYKDNQIQSEAIPFKGEVSHAKGLWSCIPHLVKEHPIFDGLESGGAMRELYENVYPIKTIRALEGETLVASVAFTWFNVENNLHFSGPKESWWGADMAIVSHGKGRCLISELRILPNLGKDPVADKILFNMMRYFAQ